MLRVRLFGRVIGLERPGSSASTNNENQNVNKPLMKKVKILCQKDPNANVQP
jgi:hypothetical protein